MLRRRLIAGAIGLVVVWAGYMLWFRNLPLFAIDEVTVTGATTNEPAIKEEGDVSAVLRQHKPGDSVSIVFTDRTGKATTAEVLAVMAAARRKVYERFGVVLEPEVQILGEVSWPEEWKLED